MDEFMINVFNQSLRKELDAIEGEFLSEVELV